MEDSWKEEECQEDGTEPKNGRCASKEFFSVIFGREGSGPKAG